MDKRYISELDMPFAEWYDTWTQEEGDDEN